MSKIKNVGKGKYLIVTPLGEGKILSDLDGLFPFKNHYAVYRTVDKEQNLKKKYGYIDEYGVKLNDRVYDHADNFDGGIAKVKLKGLQNYINEYGQEILSWSYSCCDKFISNTFIVQFKTTDGELWGLINLKEEFIIYPIFKSKIEVITEAKKHLHDIMNA